MILGCEFAPNAGIFYKSGKALSFQPHPEFADDYARALVELRRGKANDAVVDAAVGSFATPSDSALLGFYITRFMLEAGAQR